MKITIEKKPFLLKKKKKKKKKKQQMLEHNQKDCFVRIQ